LAQIHSYNETFATPAGWTLELLVAEGDGFGNTMRNYVFSRNARSSGGESGTVTFTATGSFTSVAAIHTFRDVALTSFIEAATTIANQGAGPVNCATVTPLGAKRLACMFLGGSTFGGNVASATGESGGDWTRVQHDNDGAGSAYISLQVSDQSGGGAISGGTAACTSIFSVNAHAFALVGA
jgi:hypothetical protein